MLPRSFTEPPPEGSELSDLTPLEDTAKHRLEFANNTVLDSMDPLDEPESWSHAQIQIAIAQAAVEQAEALKSVGVRLVHLESTLTDTTQLLAHEQRRAAVALERIADQVDGRADGEINLREYFKGWMAANFG